MRSRLGGLVVIAASTTVVWSAVGWTAGPASGRNADPVAVSQIVWQPCGGEGAPPTAECALLDVPLDHDDPLGAEIQLAVTRIPATDQERRIGSLFVNPGGPGASGVRSVWSGGESWSHELEGRFDIVGFDPRGVGRTEPMHCFESSEQADEFAVQVVVFPYEVEQFDDYFTHAQDYARRCLAANPTIAEHASTGDVARDMDLLREALGDDQLTFLGFSYGSYLGATYAHLYPDNVRAMVLDGALDPRSWSTGQSMQIDRRAVDDVLDEFLRLCDEAGDHCAFSGPDGAAARWRQLIDRLRGHAIDIGGGSVVTYDVFIEIVAGLLSDHLSWGGPGGLAQMLDDIDGTSGSSAESSSLRAPRQSIWPAEDSAYDNGNDAYTMVNCADIEFPELMDDWIAGHLAASYKSVFGPSEWWASAACAGWPAAPDRYAGPWGVTTAQPVLVVGNRFDPSTPISGADGLVEVLGGSGLLTWAGWGHTAYGKDSCIDRHVQDYLLDGALPPPGTVCRAGPSPFELAAAEVRAASTAVRSNTSASV